MTYSEEEPPPPPVYIISEDGLTLTKQTPAGSAAPAAAAKPAFGSIPLQCCLVGALLALFFDSSEWFNAAERYLNRQQKARMIEPYRAWARKHPLGYEEVAANTGGLSGKTVLWDVLLNPEGPSYYCEGDPRKLIEWTNPESGLRERASAERPVTVLGKVESARGETPLLTILQTY